MPGGGGGIEKLMVVVCEDEDGGGAELTRTSKSRPLSANSDSTPESSQIMRFVFGAYVYYRFYELVLHLVDGLTVK